MDHSDIVSRSRIIVPVVAAAVLGPAPALAAGGSASEERAAASQVALVRLINAARADHGLRPLRFDRKLARAALAHSRDMVANHYFAHDTRSGRQLSARIARTGWMKGRERWRVGETLAWGVGENAKPAAIVQAWLQSPPHRKIMLSPRFRLVGPGIAPGTPFDSARTGRTFTADFGSATTRREPRGALPSFSR